MFKDQDDLYLGLSQYHVLTRLWLCAFTLSLCASSPVQVQPALWLYSCTKLSHVVYAHHRVHTELLCYLRPRFPLGVRLSIPISRRLGYSYSSRSSITRTRRGSHNPLQRLSQATSVVDVTLRPRSQPWRPHLLTSSVLPSFSGPISSHIHS